jgi:hypothetical protein
MVKHLLRRNGAGPGSRERSVDPEPPGEEAGGGERRLNARSQKKYLAGLFQPGPTSNAAMLPRPSPIPNTRLDLLAKDAFLAADIGHIDPSTAQKTRS